MGGYRDPGIASVASRVIDWNPHAEALKCFGATVFLALVAAKTIGPVGGFSVVALGTTLIFGLLVIGRRAVRLVVDGTWIALEHGGEVQRVCEIDHARRVEVETTLGIPHVSPGGTFVVLVRSVPDHDGDIVEERQSVLRVSDTWDGQAIATRLANLLGVAFGPGTPAPDQARIGGSGGSS